MCDQIYKLYLCDLESGREGQIDSGTLVEMTDRMQKEFQNGSDVWIVSPDGQKILPNKQVV
jgi:hypothetical protein